MWEIRFHLGKIFRKTCGKTPDFQGINESHPSLVRISEYFEGNDIDNIAWNFFGEGPYRI